MKSTRALGGGLLARSYLIYTRTGWHACWSRLVCNIRVRQGLMDWLSSGGPVDGLWIADCYLLTSSVRYFKSSAGRRSHTGGRTGKKSSRIHVVTRPRVVVLGCFARASLSCGLGDLIATRALVWESVTGYILLCVECPTYYFPPLTPLFRS